MDRVSSVPLSMSELVFSIERRAFQIEKWICIALLVAMLLAVTITVLVRYFNLPLPGTGELATFAMAPLTFVGAAMCSYTGTHIAVDVIKHMPGDTLKKAARLLVSAAMIVFALTYLYTGWYFFINALSSGERGLDMGIPVAIPVFFLPLGMTLVLLHALAELLRVLANTPPNDMEFE